MKKSYILIILFIIFIVVISVVGSFIVTGNTKIKEEKDVLIMQDNKEVYFSCYGYDIDNPNVIVNPYGNSPLTAIIMFETNDYSDVSILIKSKDGNSDIRYTFAKDKCHLIPIYGLYADYNNTVIIESEGKNKKINIKTEKLPDDFIYEECDSIGNFQFHNFNYPYAVDINNEIRWYLNKKYYGNISYIDNGNIIIGSDKYTESNNTISFYRMNLLGKIYNDYIVANEYYGLNALYEDNVLVFSDKLLLIDLQTGEILEEYMKNDDYDYLNVDNGKIIVGKDNDYYFLEDGELKSTYYSVVNKNVNFYSNSTNYRIIPSSRLGKLKETKMSNENISLIKYSKNQIENIDISMDSNRIKITNDNDEKIYIILDKFLDKRVYEVGYIKYINTTGLKGKYTIYYQIDDMVYKTDYYIEV